MSLKINHVAVVVHELESSLSFWRDALGLPLERTESNADEGVELAFLDAAGTHIELLEPMSEDSGIGKYIAKKGAGLHHVCFEVADLELSMSQLREHGIILINDAPKTRPDGMRYCFVHPKSTGGVLVELYELLKE